MKVSKIVNAVCILIAFNLFVWLFVSDFLVVREYSYAYSKIKLTGYEVFTACHLITPVIISIIALFILSIANIFTANSNGIYKINIFINVLLIIFSVIGFVYFTGDYSYVTFGFSGILYFVFILFNIFASVFVNVYQSNEGKPKGYDFSNIEKK